MCVSGVIDETEASLGTRRSHIKTVHGWDKNSSNEFGIVLGTLSSKTGLRRLDTIAWLKNYAFFTITIFPLSVVSERRLIDVYVLLFVFVLCMWSISLSLPRARVLSTNLTTGNCLRFHLRFAGSFQQNKEKTALKSPSNS